MYSITVDIEYFNSQGDTNRFVRFIQMKKPQTQLSILLHRNCKEIGNEEFASKLRTRLRTGEGNFVNVTAFDIRDWRDKQTFPHQVEVKIELLKYFKEKEKEKEKQKQKQKKKKKEKKKKEKEDKKIKNFSDLVFSRHNLESLIRRILYDNFKKVLAKDNFKYQAYDVRILHSALNVKASSTTLTYAIILNYIYRQAELKHITNIRLINLIDASDLIRFVAKDLKLKNGFKKIDDSITKIWNDLTLPRINFKSVEKIVLRHTLSTLWDNDDFLI